MADDSTYVYDVFISYSTADREWAEEWLRPRLEAAGLNVCTDDDFEPGVPRLINIERAVGNSRQALLVLTPAWVASEWSEFAALLSQTSDPSARQRRLLPLMLEPCQVPSRIGMLTSIDFIRKDKHDKEIQRVAKVVRGELRLPERPLSQEQRNRSRMLQKVRSIWIEGLLEQSLAKELRIALNLTEQSDAVHLPLNALVQELRHPPRPLPSGTPIIRVFEQMGGALLILGAPGAGKTTLLLELTRDLIAHAEQDEGHPIPVVFNLSSWAAKPRPLKEWLVEELNTKYDVPHKLTHSWLDAGGVLPLLDGLDEVAPEQRNDCAESINTYRKEHGLVPLAVCSRVGDYEALTTKLRLQGAIVVQPLTKQQVDEYFERAAERLTGVRAALRNDEGLGEILDTPLMLSIVALAYAGKSAAEVQAVGTADERRRHLFDTYIAAMFQRRSKDTRYKREKATYWLSWLAGQMVRHNQTALYIERMQPDWLRRWRRLSFAIRVGLLNALIFGLLVGLIFGLLVGLIFGLQVGLVFGLLVGLVGGLSSYPAEIRPIETLRWSWIAAGGGRRSSLVFALTFGLVGGLIGELSIGLPLVLPTVLLTVPLSRLIDALVGSGLVFGLQVGLVLGPVGWVLGWLVGEVTEGQITKQTIVDNPQFRRLVWHIFVGLVFGVLGGLNVGLNVGLVGGLGGGLGGALVFVLDTRNILTRTVDSKSVRRAAWAALASGLVVGLASQLVFGLDFGLVFGLLGTTFGWLGSWLSDGPRTHQATLQNKALRRFARNTLSGGLVFGLGAGLVFGLNSGQYSGLVGGLLGALIGALGGGLLSGLIEGDITTRTVTNEGIRRSIYSAVVGGCIGGLLTGLVFGLLSSLLVPPTETIGGQVVERYGRLSLLVSPNYRLISGLVGGLVGGAVFGLLYGGATVLQHYTLRWMLYRNGSLPFRDLVPFLDYCADRIFLRKVGGGYIFVHRLLMEHFASLDTSEKEHNAPPSR